MRRWIASAVCALAAGAGLISWSGANSPAWAQSPTAAGPRPASSRSAAPNPNAAADGGRSDAVKQELLKRVRSLIQRHQFRTAEQLLLDSSSAAPRDAAGSLDALLGEVYFRSGQNAKALDSLHRALAWYRQIPRPMLPTLREQSRVACLLADVYSRQAEPIRAIDTLEQMLARYDHHDVVDSPTQLELASRLGALLWARPVAGHSVGALDSEVDWLAARLRSDRSRLSADAFAQGMVSLAKYQTASLRYDRAIETLKDLIDWWGSSRDGAVALEVRLQLAQIYGKKADLGAEIRALHEASDQARALQRSAPRADAGAQVQSSYELAKIEQLTADALIGQHQTSQAAEQLALAFRDYRTAEEQTARQSAAGAETADLSEIPLLERIVEVGDRLIEVQGGGSVPLADNIGIHEALRARYEKSLLPDDPRLGRLDVSLGGLYLENSQFEAARGKLSRARDFWSQYRPQNVPLLVQTLNLLTECDLAIGSPERLREANAALAEAGQRAEQLAPSDALRWWVRLNRGRLQAAQGRYQQALDELGQIVADRSQRSVPPRIESLALLQLGLLYKEQLEFDEALQYCRRALAVRDAELSPDSPERLDYYLALGELYMARNDVSLHDDRSLDEVIRRADSIGSRLPEIHPARVAILHLQAMAHYLSDQRKSDAGQRQAARDLWNQLIAMCRRTGQSSMEARAMHYLARLDFLDWTAQLRAWSEKLRSANPAENDASVKNLKRRIVDYNARQIRLEQSRKEYRRAVEAYHQLAGERYQVQHEAYQSLQARLAAIEHEQTALDELNAALTQERQNVLKAHDDGAARHDAVDPADRSRWQALLAHGEQLEQQALARLRTTGLYPSLLHAALCNEAQILQAESQLDTSRPRLLERALAALQEAVAVIEDPRSATFAGDFMRAEFFSQYQSAFDLQVQFRVEAGQFAEAIVAAEQGRSRTLLDQLWPDNARHEFSAEKTAQIVDARRRSDQPLLYYYIGDTASYLFVLGGSLHDIQSFPLRVESGASVAGLGNSASSRYIATVVERLRDNFRDERSARQILTNPAIASDLAGASAVLLPPAAVDYLRHEAARGAACVTVVPHKAVSQLPLEALVVGAEGNRGYLADCCPPIAYAPSLDVLDDLRQRPSRTAGTPKLLTLGDPDFVAKHGGTGGGASAGETGLVPLPDAADECREIARDFAARFGAGSVVSLTHAAAGEAPFRAAIHDNRFTFLHMATHGIVGMERGQPFGRMILTPSPSSPSSPISRSDDGFLDLDEIRRLDLGGCQLVALSACNTNVGTAVGRQTVRAAGGSNSSATRNAARLAQVDTCFSLASAFLAAGSRRVLATQWEVADRSTKILMVSFFDKLGREIERGQSINYAQLLAQSRKDLRTSHPEFDSPFHWASFVLIGPAESSAPHGN